MSSSSDAGVRFKCVWYLRTNTLLNHAIHTVTNFENETFLRIDMSISRTVFHPLPLSSFSLLFLAVTRLTFDNSLFPFSHVQYDHLEACGM
jgi:hypothetical protein